MAYDKVIDSSKLNSAMTATANAIRGKTGGTSQIAWNESTGFASAVETIEVGDGDAENVVKQFLDTGVEEIVNTTATQVRGYCFYGHPLKKADFGSKLKYIRHHAFYGCTDLKTLILRRNGVVALATKNAFDGTNFYDPSYEPGDPLFDYDTDEFLYGTLYVPAAYIEAYKSDSAWSQMLNGSVQVLAIEGSEYE